VEPIRIGVVGCGRIAQVMHLPFLAELPQFELTALADVSSETLDHLAPRYPGASCHADHAELLERADVDAVAVLTPDHAAIVEQAAAAGKHVFVEKPMCFDPGEGRRIVEAVEAGGVTLMVGYTRHFDPAFRRLRAELPGLGPIRFARARDHLGLRSVPAGIYTLAPGGAAGGRAEEITAKLAACVGTAEGALVELYWVLLMLASHDLAALRDVLGQPREVVAAELLGDRRAVAVLGYEGGLRALLEVGVWAEHTWFDARLDLYSDTAVASVSFPNPWVRYLPSELVRLRAEGDGAVEERGPLSYADRFREQWLGFAQCLAEGRQPASDARAGLADIELAVAIVRAVPAGRG
jgi:predicted dehydrogenase